MFDTISLYVARVMAGADRDEGQTLVEYALILTLVSIAAITALGLLGGQIGTVLDSVRSAI